MTSSPKFKIPRRFLPLLLTLGISILMGFVWFILLYGRSTLNFTNVDWIYLSGGDLFQHQIGWEWFRQEPWRFPLGRIDAYGYPFGTYISYTDSIPILAFFFKLLDPLLPQNFQYLGFWELTSNIGQFVFGMLILGEFTSSYPKKILGASMLVLSPIMLSRAFFHDSLTAQWILLAGIWFVMLEYRQKLWRGAWLILFVTAMLVHLYFVAMLIPLWVVSSFWRYRRERKHWLVIAEVLAVSLTIFLVGYAIGIFSLSIGNLLGEGYGFYSWNLNGFLDPGEASRFLDPLKTGPEGQEEGFSYLGLGFLIILPVAVVLFIKKDRSRRNYHFLASFILISMIYVFFALSNKAFLNDQALWNFQLPKKIEIIFALFRASGRFIWPVFYFTVLFGLISVIRNIKVSTPIILAALILQFLDLQPLYASKRVDSSLTYQSPLHSEFWHAAATYNQHVFLIPAAKAHSVYEPLALYARQNKMTLNWGYFSRANLGGIKDLGDQVWEELLASRPDNQTVYLFWNSEWENLVKDQLSDKMLICLVDGYSVALSEDNALAQADFDLSHYCSFH